MSIAEEIRTTAHDQFTMQEIFRSKLLALLASKTKLPLKQRDIEWLENDLMSALFEARQNGERRVQHAVREALGLPPAGE